MNLVFALSLLYGAIVVGLLRLQMYWIAEDPTEMPGGGRRAVLIRTLAWPLILVGLFFVIILMVFEL